MPELMPVIAQRQRRLDIFRKGREAAEMRHPCHIVQTVKTDAGSGPVIAPPQQMPGEASGLDRTVEPVVKLQMDGRGAVGCHQP